MTAGALAALASCVSSLKHCPDSLGAGTWQPGSLPVTVVAGHSLCRGSQGVVGADEEAAVRSSRS